MKLAEALQERADLNRKIEQLLSILQAKPLIGLETQRLRSSLQFQLPIGRQRLTKWRRNCGL